MVYLLIAWWIFPWRTGNVITRWYVAWRILNKLRISWRGNLRRYPELLAFAVNVWDIVLFDTSISTKIPETQRLLGVPLDKLKTSLVTSITCSGATDVDVSPCNRLHNRLHNRLQQITRFHGRVPMELIETAASSMTWSCCQWRQRNQVEKDVDCDLSVRF